MMAVHVVKLLLLLLLKFKIIVLFRVSMITEDAQ